MAWNAKNLLTSGTKVGGSPGDVLEGACGGMSGMWQGFQPFGVLCGRYTAQGTGNGKWNVNEWKTTLVEAGAGETTLTVNNAHPPTLVAVTDANESDGVNCQWAAFTDNDALTTSAVVEAFKYVAGQNQYFEARLKMDDSTQSKGEFGFCITDTTLNGGMTDGIYFRKKDGDQTWFFVLEKNSTETETELTTALGSTELADDTWITIGFRFVAGATAATSHVDVYVNGARVNVNPAMTNLCDDEELALSFCYLTGEANASTLTISHIVGYQEAI